jgi:hypothetical protein
MTKIYLNRVSRKDWKRIKKQIPKKPDYIEINDHDGLGFDYVEVKVTFHMKQCYARKFAKDIPDVFGDQ